MSRTNIETPSLLQSPRPTPRRTNSAKPASPPPRVRTPAAASWTEEVAVGLIADLGSPSAEHRVKTRSQLDAFESLSRLYKERNRRQEALLQAANAKKFDQIYAENCKQQFELDEMERQVFHTEELRHKQLVKSYNSVRAEVANEHKALETLRFTKESLDLEFEQCGASTSAAEAAVSAARDELSKVEESAYSVQAYTPQLQHMLARLQHQVTDDLTEIDTLRDRLSIGDTDLQQLVHIEHDLTTVTTATQNQLEKVQAIASADRYLRGKGLAARRELLQRQKRMQESTILREMKMEEIRERIWKQSAFHKRTVAARRAQHRMAELNNRQALSNMIAGKRPAFRLGDMQYSAEEAKVFFDRMSVATGVSITGPEEALERFEGHRPRREQLDAEVQLLETTIEKQKTRLTAASAELEVVKDKYNGLGLQIHRTALDDIRKKIERASKDETRIKADILALFELMSTVRAGVDMMAKRVDLIRMKFRHRVVPDNLDPTAKKVIILTAKLAQVLEAVQAAPPLGGDTESIISSLHRGSMSATPQPPDADAQPTLDGGPAFFLTTMDPSEPTEDTPHRPARNSTPVVDGLYALSAGSELQPIDRRPTPPQLVLELGASAPIGSGSPVAAADTVDAPKPKSIPSWRSRSSPRKTKTMRKTSKQSMANGRAKPPPPPQATEPVKAPAFRSHNNIRVGPSVSTESLVSVNTAQLFESSSSEDEGSDKSESERAPSPVHDTITPYRRMAMQVKAARQAIVEEIQRRTRKEARRARMLEGKSTRFDASQRNVFTPSTPSPMPPESPPSARRHAARPPLLHRLSGKGDSLRHNA